MSSFGDESEIIIISNDPVDDPNQQSEFGGYDPIQAPEEYKFLPTLLWFFIPAGNLSGAFLYMFQGWYQDSKYSRVAVTELISAMISFTLFQYANTLDQGFAKI